MTPLDAAVAEFQKTIADLMVRLANMASENATLAEEIKTLKAGKDADKG